MYPIGLVIILLILKIINVVNNGADVINHSYGGSQYSTLLRSAHAYAYKLNRVTVASMGNENSTSLMYPAAYGQGILAVGSTTRNDNLSYFSNQGNHIDIAAPGSFITSTWRDNSYNVSSGTSMAAPIVSGIATLLKGYNSDLFNDDIENIIKLSAEDVNGATYPGFDSEMGHGRVNAHKALLRLQSPYVLNHHTASGGYVANVNQETKVFYDTPGLANGVYVVKRNEVRKTVNFPYMSEAHVWGRGVATIGYSGTNPNFAMGWNEPVSVSNNSATLRTYVYEVFSISGQRIGWYPTSPSNVTFAYTLHGIPGSAPLSVNIFGPTSLYSGQSGFWNAGVSNGTAPFSYQWQKRNSGSSYWYNIGTNSSYSGTFSNDVDLKVIVTDSNNNTATDIISVSVSGAIPKVIGQEPNAIPENFGLTQNYPNPFNPTTNLAFELPEQSQVSLTVFNIMGQKVTILVDDNLNAGFHTYSFEASSLPSGVYVAQMEAIGLSGEVFSKSIKMQLIK